MHPKDNSTFHFPKSLKNGNENEQEQIEEKKNTHTNCPNRCDSYCDPSYTFYFRK